MQGMTSVGVRLTAEEFARLPEDDSGGRMELVNGEVVVAPSPGGQHGLIENEVAKRLNQLLEQVAHGVLLHNAGVLIRQNPDVVRAPDIAVFFDLRPTDVPPGYLVETPDVAVEVVSPNDVAHDVQRKVAEYLAAGVGRVWTVWPETRSVTVHLPGGASQTYATDEVLRDDTLGFDAPAFSLPVREIFPPLANQSQPN